MKLIQSRSVHTKKLRIRTEILKIGMLNTCLITEFFLSSFDEQRRIVAYLDGLSERVSELRRLQAKSQVELDALLPSVLDRAFKGEL